jgi:hypothetical protein
VLTATDYTKLTLRISNQHKMKNTRVFKMPFAVICDYRVEEIEHRLMQKIRYLDKLIDELAKGKAMQSF